MNMLFVLVNEFDTVPCYAYATEAAFLCLLEFGQHGNELGAKCGIFF